MDLILALDASKAYIQDHITVYASWKKKNKMPK